MDVLLVAETYVKERESEFDDTEIKHTLWFMVPAAKYLRKIKWGVTFSPQAQLESTRTENFKLETIYFLREIVIVLLRFIHVQVIAVTHLFSWSVSSPETFELWVQITDDNCNKDFHISSKGKSTLVI